jgi:hypothetical protein
LTSASYTPQLRPLSIGEVLDAGFRLLRARFGTLVLCALVPLVPLTILSTIIVASADPSTFDVNATTASDSGSANIGTLMDRLLTGAAAALAIASCFKVISATYLGERSGAGESLRYGLTRLLPLMVAYIVMSIALPIAFIALIVPFFYLGVKWSMTYAAIVAERTGPFAGMGRSWELTRGHWWRVFGTLLVVVLITFVLSFVALVAIGAGAVALDDSIGTTAYATVITLATILVLAVLYPLIAAIVTVLYYDLRVRNEGFDLQLLAQGVGADASRFESAPERPAAPSSTPPPSPSPSPGTGGFAPPEGSAPTS